MPEARDRLPERRAGARDLAQGFGIGHPLNESGFGPGDLSRGFVIRHGSFYAARPRNGRAQNLHRSPSDDKENIPPGSSRRPHRPRKSPLPSWYPRTPLRDITAIVNAMERRRNRLRAAAEVHRRHQESIHLSPPLPFLASPSRQELSVAEQTLPPHVKNEDYPPEISDSSPRQAAVIETPPQLVINSLESSPSTVYTATADLNLIAVEKKFAVLIDEIGRSAMKNMQRMAKMAPKKKPNCSTLMSLR